MSIDSEPTCSSKTTLSFTKVNKRPERLSKSHQDHESISAKTVAFFQLFLSETTNNQRRALLKTITNSQLKALIQIVTNYLQGVITVKPAALKAIEKHKRPLRGLADETISLKTKRQTLNKRQKAITEFLKAVIPAIKSYLR